MKVRCFHCGKEYEVAEGQAGARMECEDCGKAFTVHPDEAKKPNDFKMPPKPPPKKLGRKATKPVLKMPPGMKGEGGRAGRFSIRMTEVPVRVSGSHILLMCLLLVACLAGGAGLATRLEQSPMILVGMVCAVLAIFVPLALLWVLGAARAAALRQEHIERLLAEISAKLPVQPPVPHPVAAEGKPAPPPVTPET